MIPRPLLSVTLFSSTLALLAFAGWRLSDATPKVTRDSATSVVMAASIPTSMQVNDETWKLPVVRAIPEAATECGIVSIKNAPASIGVSYTSRGRISGIEIDSSLFGGEETESCVRKQLETVQVGSLREAGNVKVALPMIVPGC